MAAAPKHVWTTDAWAKLKEHVPKIEGVHLRELLAVCFSRVMAGDLTTLADRASYLLYCADDAISIHLFVFESLQDADRCAGLVAEFDGLCLDYSRQRVTGETMALLHSLADAANLKGKIADMAAGKHINITEDRAVMHMALRAPKDAVSSAAVNHPASLHLLQCVVATLTRPHRLR